MIILGQPSLGVLLSNDQDQADMASAIAIILVILVIGIVVDMLFNVGQQPDPAALGRGRERGLAGRAGAASTAPAQAATRSAPV